MAAGRKQNRRRRKETQSPLQSASNRTKEKEKRNSKLQRTPRSNKYNRRTIRVKCNHRRPFLWGQIQKIVGISNKTWSLHSAYLYFVRINSSDIRRIGTDEEIYFTVSGVFSLFNIHPKHECFLLLLIPWFTKSSKKREKKIKGQKTKQKEGKEGEKKQPAT